MLDSPDKLANPRTHDHEGIIKDLISQGETEQAARDKIAGGFRTIMSTPISNKLFIEQRRKQHEAEKNSIIDPLTGLYNRRYIFGNESEPNPSGELRRLFLEAKREGKPLSVIMMDIDHFKKVNDDYSHEAGDSVLKQLAKVIKKTIRETDILARIGGEEFFLVLEDTDLAGAKKLAEKIREVVENNNLNPDRKASMPNKITISAGVSTFTEESKKINSETDLFKTADKALSLAKGAARNRVWVTEEITLENGEVIFHFHDAFIERKKPDVLDFQI